MPIRRQLTAAVVASLAGAAFVVPSTGAAIAAAADADTTTVPATSDIFAAGGTTVPDLPQGGGTLPPSLSIVPGQGFTVSVNGAVNSTGALNGPDGTKVIGTNISSYGRISGIRDDSSALFLVGVFRNEAVGAGVPPAALDFSPGGLTENFRTLSPRPDQTFFIGDGLASNPDGSTVPQIFVAPSGTTKLYLGIADAELFRGSPSWYGDNTGEFSVKIGRDYRYVALGDSFASGEGAKEAEFGGTTFPDPKVPGSTTGCHRSTTSWANDVAAGLLAAKAVNSWRLVACSGAVVDNLYARNRTYQTVSGSPEPAQMSFVDQRTYRATLSIGGNDANFAPLLRACVQYPRNDGGGLNCRKKNAAGRKLADAGMARLRDGIPVPSLGPGVVKPLAQVYFDIATKMAPGGRLVVAGYPKLFATSRAGYDFGGLCKVGTGLGNVSVHMLYEDAQWLNGLTDSADSYIRSAVGDANRALNRANSTVVVDYADTNAEFTDHRLCSGNRWFNGVELTFKWPPKPKQVSFHPNAKGQDAYVRAVRPKAMVGVAVS